MGKPMTNPRTFSWLPLKTVVVYTTLSLVAMQMIACMPELFDFRYGWPFVGFAAGIKGTYSEDISLKAANFGISAVLVLATALLARRIITLKTQLAFTIASALKLTLYISLVFALWLNRHDVLAAVLVARGYPPSDAYINWRLTSCPWFLVPGIWIGLLSAVTWVGIAISFLWAKITRRAS